MCAVCRDTGSCAALRCQQAECDCDAVMRLVGRALLCVLLCRQNRVVVLSHHDVHYDMHDTSAPDCCDNSGMIVGDLHCCVIVSFSIASSR